MRERVEDLGRIMAMLEKVMDDELWDATSGRPKHFMEWFFSQSRSTQEDLLASMAYGIERNKEEIWKCIEIARGHDYLNDQEPQL